MYADADGYAGGYGHTHANANHDTDGYAGGYGHADSDDPTEQSTQ